MDSKINHDSPLSGGLQTDLHPLTAPAEILTDAVNSTVFTDMGNQKISQNRIGNVFASSFPTGYTPLKTKVYEGIAYILSYNFQEDKLQLGTFPSPAWDTLKGETGDLELTYKPLRNLKRDGVLKDFTVSSAPGDNTELLFNPLGSVDVTLQPIYDDSINIIFTDGTNPIRLVNAGFAVLGGSTYTIPERATGRENNQYDVKTLEKDSKLLISNDDNSTNLEISEVSAGGVLPCGAISVYARYVDEEGNFTDVVAHTASVSILKGAGAKSYSAEGATDKKMVLTFDNLNTEQYSRLDILYMQTPVGAGGTAVKQLKRLANPIRFATSRLEYTLTGSEATVTLDDTEILQAQSSIKSCKTLEQSDNRLLLGNISYNYNEDLAIEDFINKVSVNVQQELLPLDFFADSQNHIKAGYWPEETYCLGLRFVWKDETQSPVYPLKTAWVEDAAGNTLSIKSGVNKEQVIREDWTSLPGRKIWYKVEGSTRHYYSEEGILPIPMDHDTWSSSKTEKFYQSIISLQFPSADGFIVKDKYQDNVSVDLQELVKAVYVVRADKSPSQNKVLFQGAAVTCGKTSSRGLGGGNLLDLVSSEDTLVTPFTDIQSVLHWPGGEATRAILNPSKITLPESTGSKALYSPDMVLNESYVRKHVSSSDATSLRIRKSASFTTREQKAGGISILKEVDKLRRSTDAARNVAATFVEREQIRRRNSEFSSVLGGDTKYTPDTEKDKAAERLLTYLKFSQYIGLSTETRGLEEGVYTVYGPNIPNTSVYSDVNSVYFRGITGRLDFSPGQTHLIRGGDCFFGTTYITVFRGDSTAELGVPEKATTKTQGRAYFIFGVTCRSRNNPYTRFIPGKEGESAAMFYPKDGLSSKFSISSFPEYQTLEALSQPQNELYAASLGNLLYTRDFFQTRIAYTGTQNTGEFSNGYRAVRGLSYKDYPRNAGSIVKLINFQGVLYCVQENGVGIVQTNRQAVAEDLVIGNYAFLPEKINYLNARIGSSWLNSIVDTDQALYGISSTEGVIWAVSGNQLTDISFMNVSSLVKPIVADMKSKEYDPRVFDIKSFYNYEDKEVKFVVYRDKKFRDTYASLPNKLFAGRLLHLAYSELEKKFLTRHDWYPGAMFNLAQRSYTMPGHRVEEGDISYGGIWRNGHQRDYLLSGATLITSAPGDNGKLLGVAATPGVTTLSESIQHADFAQGKAGQASVEYSLDNQGVVQDQAKLSLYSPPGSTTAVGVDYVKLFVKPENWNDTQFEYSSNPLIVPNTPEDIKSALLSRGYSSDALKLVDSLHVPYDVYENGGPLNYRQLRENLEGINERALVNKATERDLLISPGQGSETASLSNASPNIRLENYTRGMLVMTTAKSFYVDAYPGRPLSHMADEMYKQGFPGLHYIMNGVTTSDTSTSVLPVNYNLKNFLSSSGFCKAVDYNVDKIYSGFLKGFTTSPAYVEAIQWYDQGGGRYIGDRERKARLDYAFPIGYDISNTTGLYTPEGSSVGNITGDTAADVVFELGKKVKGDNFPFTSDVMSISDNIQTHQLNLQKRIEANGEEITSQVVIVAGPTLAYPRWAVGLGVRNSVAFDSAQAEIDSWLGVVGESDTNAKKISVNTAGNLRRSPAVIKSRTSGNSVSSASLDTYMQAHNKDGVTEAANGPRSSNMTIPSRPIRYGFGVFGAWESAFVVDKANLSVRDVSEGVVEVSVPFYYAVAGGSGYSSMGHTKASEGSGRGGEKTAISARGSAGMYLWDSVIQDKELDLSVDVEGVETLAYGIQVDVTYDSRESSYDSLKQEALDYTTDTGDEGKDLIQPNTPSMWHVRADSSAVPKYKSVSDWTKKAINEGEAGHNTAVLPGDNTKYGTVADWTAQLNVPESFLRKVHRKVAGVIKFQIPVVSTDTNRIAVTYKYGDAELLDSAVGKNICSHKISFDYNPGQVQIDPVYKEPTPYMQLETLDITNLVRETSENKQEAKPYVANKTEDSEADGSWKGLEVAEVRNNLVNKTLDITLASYSVPRKMLAPAQYVPDLSQGKTPLTISGGSEFTLRNEENKVVTAGTLDASSSSLVIPDTLDSGRYRYKVRSKRYPQVMSEGWVSLVHKTRPVYCNYFGKQRRYEVEFVVNQNSAVLKVLENLQIIGNKVKPKSIEYTVSPEPGITFPRSGTGIDSSYPGDNLNYPINGTQPTDAGYLADVQGTVMPDGTVRFFEFLEERMERNSTRFKGMRGNITTANYHYSQGKGNIVTGTRLQWRGLNGELKGGYSAPNIFERTFGSIGGSSRRLRDKWFKVRLKYDGAHYTLIQNVISYLSISL